jgi:hypothetical protein
MARRANKTSFKPGHKRSPESIEKQRATLKAQYAAGLRKPPGQPGPNPKKGQSGPKNNHWVPVGTRSQTSAGYMRIKVADPSEWMFEHRYVVEQSLGRQLRTEEHVHHKNGVRDDNRLENLIVMHRDVHNRERFPRCAVCGYVHPPH